MNTKQIIINADDFGLHPEINQGILESHLGGVLTSATLLAPGDFFDQAVEYAAAMPKLSIGVHLALVGGLKPILPKNQIPTLLTSQGLFRKDHRSFIRDWALGRIRSEEIHREWAAQIQKIISAGIQPSHLDSHQHLHVLPGMTGIISKLTETFNIPAVRIPKEPYSFRGHGITSFGRMLARDGLTLLARRAQKEWSSHLFSPDFFFGMLFGGNMTLDSWKYLIPQIPSGISEIMVHPGKSNHNLGASFGWGYHWQEEFEALKSKELFEWLTKSSVHLINYRKLKKSALTRDTF